MAWHGVVWCGVACMIWHEVAWCGDEVEERKRWVTCGLISSLDRRPVAWFDKVGGGIA